MMMSNTIKQKMSNTRSGTKLNISSRLGFMEGEIAVPDDFDQMGNDEIATMFDATTISTREHQFNRDEANRR
jgi:hypothetical protein